MKSIPDFVQSETHKTATLRSVQKHLSGGGEPGQNGGSPKVFELPEGGGQQVFKVKGGVQKCFAKLIV